MTGVGPSSLSFGDDEPGGDVAQAQFPGAQVQGHGQHVVVSDAGAADVLAPRVRADSWPSRVRSRMYSRSIPDRAASTVNTIPDGSCEPCSSLVRNSQAHVGGFQLLGQRGQCQAASQALVLVDDEGDRGAGGPDFPGEVDDLVEFGPGGGAGRDLLGEDPGDAGGTQGVELGIQGLPGGGSAGVADPDVPGRLGVACDGTGQFDPYRARFADGGGGDAESLGQFGVSIRCSCWRASRSPVARAWPAR